MLCWAVTGDRTGQQQCWSGSGLQHANRLTSCSLLSVVQSRSQRASSTRLLQVGAAIAPVTSGRKWWKDLLLGDTGPLPKRSRLLRVQLPSVPSVPLPMLPSTLPLAAAGPTRTHKQGSSEPRCTNYGDISYFQGQSFVLECTCPAAEQLFRLGESING